MFSFIIFGSSTKDNLEATEERMAHFLSVSKDSPKFTEVFGHGYDSFIHKESQKEEVKIYPTEYKMVVQNVNRTVEFNPEEDSKTSSVLVEDFKEDDLVTSSDEQSIVRQNDKEFEFNVYSENNERIPTEVNNQQNLACALKEMMNDMGISHPSYEYSDLHKNTSTILDSTYRDSRIINPQGKRNYNE